MCGVVFGPKRVNHQTIRESPNCLPSPAISSRLSSSWKLREVALALFRLSRYRQTWYSIHRMTQLSPFCAWPKAYHPLVSWLAFIQIRRTILLNAASVYCAAANGGGLCACSGLKRARFSFISVSYARIASSWNILASGVFWGF